MFEIFDKSSNTVTFSKSKQTELQEKKKNLSRGHTLRCNWIHFPIGLSGNSSDVLAGYKIRSGVEMWRFFSFSTHRGLVFSLCLLSGLGSPKSNLSKLLSSFLEQKYRGQDRKREEQSVQKTQHSVKTLASCKPSLSCIWNTNEPERKYQTPQL